MNQENNMSDQKMESKESKKMLSLSPGRAITFKAIILGFLLLLLLIPLTMLDSLRSEREYRRNDVEQEILYSWGGITTLSGPLLIIPYEEEVERVYQEENKEPEKIKETIYGRIQIIPETSQMDVGLQYKERKRSIYSIPLYIAQMEIQGSFDISILHNYQKPGRKLFLDQALVQLSASDISGLNDIKPLEWESSSYDFTPSSSIGVLNDAVFASVPIDLEQHTYSFKTSLSLQGGRELRFLPMAKSMYMNLDADTAGISFIGRYLPVEHNQEENRFQAQWEIQYMSAHIPPSWTLEEQYNLNLTNASFGVGLVDRVSVYLKNERAQKYGILFLLIPFLSFFLFEILRKKNIHPLQYLIAAMANLVFYVLLLSVSEHLGFNLSYLIAASAVILMLSLYSISVFRTKGYQWVAPLVLSTTYGYLYIVLQSEDYALLLGSIGLFLLLSAVMFITRNIDWYKKTEK